MASTDSNGYLKVALGSGGTISGDQTFTGNITILGDLNFGDASTDDLIINKSGAAAGSDSCNLKWLGVTSAGDRYLTIINEADAATDTYRFRFNNNGGTQLFAINESGNAIVSNALLPDTNDGATLGAAATAFSDLYLASGALIGWGNGNTLLGHTAGVGLGISNPMITSAGSFDYGLSLTQELNDPSASGGTQNYSGLNIDITPTDITGWDNVMLMTLKNNLSSVMKVDIYGTTVLSRKEFTSGGTDDKVLDLSVTLNDAGAAGGTDYFRLIKGTVTETNVTGWDDTDFIDLDSNSGAEFRVTLQGNLFLTHTAAIQPNEAVMDVYHDENFTATNTSPSYGIIVASSSFTLTGPGAGTASLGGLVADLSGVSVVAGVGSVLTAALALTACSSANSENYALLANGNGWFVGSATATPDTPVITAKRSALGGTTLMGLGALNDEPAAAGAQQASPSLILSGQGWKTDAVAGSQPVDFQIYTLPVQGAAAPTGTLVYQARINDGAWSTLGDIDSSGNVRFPQYRPYSATFAILNGLIADGAAAIGCKIGNVNSLTTSGAKIVSFYSDNLSTEKAYIDKDGSIYSVGRKLGYQGSDVASANDITLGLGNYFDLTGVTDVQRILGTGWTAGTVITLQTDGAIKIVNNTAAGGGYYGFQLAGSANFEMTAGDTLTVVFDGAWFREIARSVI